ncbi:GPP34 family phosphoprotein [Catellatospora chokoriensis]|uniref:Uncharacterized protein n=1 Tax=Catellatospora chokoriensis TaxID=310353 RepID=A0A8J3NSL1_9ACTN|nr:GPP34 family phosphoprotein [Catellatospora chokoriensis]GIF90643.1 hypothetical protein Cch02nite_40870 [Catellatospora chokoriensis]
MLGDDYHRIAHHDVTGAPRQHARAIALGCTAALLAELISSRHVTAAQGTLKIDDRTPPQDSLAHTISSGSPSPAASACSS